MRKSKNEHNLTPIVGWFQGGVARGKVLALPGLKEKKRKRKDKKRKKRKEKRKEKEKKKEKKRKRKD